ncbi:S1/P1 Nuclease [Chryseolinea serpens]|uniref:S1/P1 Nuclease n=1 Tax=Chryseolinea serpens TaxID=947013 RepID=A0A1M5N1M8_9BACT|nr:hypothetical protein [Chryseolinea serpens]SHG83470.1 S1/P1 Nuclease [Chryseolinea serpens]
MSTTKQFNFNHLSVKDLVDARDMFHVHLINKRNVVATAIGRYLIRHSDIDSHGKFIDREKGQGSKMNSKQRDERTLSNSMVIDISWPCILVFVKHWETEEDLIKRGASDIVPKTIYMPDGRVVPICTVVAPKVSLEKEKIDINKIRFPEGLMGGGFPLLIQSQGITKVASAGCIVTDGHTYYALTNRHVAGEAGQEIKTLFGSKETCIGKSSGNSIGKIPFNDLYKGWESNNQLVSCDTGLIEISNVNEWKTEILDIPRMDEMFEINTLNLSLGIIAEHSKANGVITDSISGNVVARGAVSGVLKGEILGLFYRYKTVGGAEYVSEFLIAGRNGKDLEVHHGDSGSVWLLESKDEDDHDLLQPIALHWGQHAFLQNASDKLGYAYSLSSCLSSICRELDVELVRGWNIDLDYSWGESGHYTIGNRAVFALNRKKYPKLYRLMKNNADNISYDDAAIKQQDYNKSTDNFTPLVDVPDTVFKARVSGISRFPYENPNHYADVDLTRESDGKSLLELSKKKENLTVEFWQAFYDETDHTEMKERGLLPFRVKQIFMEMVNYLKNNDTVGFVAAAGVLGHYIGDGCQPLHGSKITNGDGRPETEGVHSAYETKMIDKNRVEIVDSLNDRITAQHASKKKFNKIPSIGSPDEAAQACINLLDVTMTQITPQQINDTYYDAVVSDSKAAGVKALWEAYGDKTIDTLARGSRYLAKYWEAAWELGKGETKTAIKTTKIAQGILKERYEDKEKFLKSYSLDTIHEYFDSNS